jgi:hypothetical protein
MSRSPPNCRISMGGSVYSGASTSSVHLSGQEALADALRLQQRRKEIAEEAKKRRESAELANCTFKPALTPRSERMVESGARKDKPALHTPRARSVDCLPIEEPIPKSPSLMNDTSRVIVALSGRCTAPVHERLISFKEKAVARHENERIERARKEEALATHQPEICSNSEKMVKKRSTGTTAMERLTQEYLQVGRAIGVRDMRHALVNVLVHSIYLTCHLPCNCTCAISFYYRPGADAHHRLSGAEKSSKARKAAERGGRAAECLHSTNSPHE